jgi:hypothetical protein
MVWRDRERSSEACDSQYEGAQRRLLPVNEPRKTGTVAHARVARPKLTNRFTVLLFKYGIFIL